MYYNTVWYSDFFLPNNFFSIFFSIFATLTRVNDGAWPIAEKDSEKVNIHLKYNVTYICDRLCIHLLYSCQMHNVKYICIIVVKYTLIHSNHSFPDFFVFCGAVPSVGRGTVLTVWCNGMIFFFDFFFFLGFLMTGGALPVISRGCV